MSTGRKWTVEEVGQYYWPDMESTGLSDMIANEAGGGWSHDEIEKIATAASQYGREALESLPVTGKTGTLHLRGFVRSLFGNHNALVNKASLIATMTKSDCLNLIVGATTPQQIAEEFEASGYSDVAEPDEGVEGDNPPDGVSHASETIDDAPYRRVETMLTAVGAMTAVDELSKYIEAVAKQAAKQAASCAKPEPLPVICNGTVKVGGAELPVLYDGDSPVDMDGNPVPSEVLERIGTPDPTFNGNAWRAVKKYGAVTIRSSVSSLIRAINTGLPTCLVGPTGCGKSTVIAWLASLCKTPLYRLNNTKDGDVSQYIGCYEAVNGSTVWVDGLLAKAARHGGWFLNDDADRVPADVQQATAAIMERGGKLVNGTTGEVITPHPNFRFIATMNAGFYGDHTGHFASAQVQDGQITSRFAAVFHVDYPTPGNEVKILQSVSGVDKDVAKNMVALAGETRAAAANEGSDMQVGIDMRGTINWSVLHASAGIPLDEAFALAVLNKLPTCDVGAVAEMAQRVFGKDLGNIS